MDEPKTLNHEDLAALSLESLEQATGGANFNPLLKDYFPHGIREPGWLRLVDLGQLERVELGQQFVR